MTEHPPKPENSVRFNNIFVLGVPHCGSTLLGMMLNSHPDICCLGESALTGHAINISRPCSCGKQVQSCEFWQPLLPIFRPKDINDYRRYTPGMYAQIRDKLGVPILVDLSKSLAWRMNSGLFSPWKRSRTGYIFVVRDSRAVISSRVPSDEDALNKILNQHKKWTLRLCRFIRRLGDRSLTVYYEDFCTRPEAEMERICSWLQVPYSERMLDPYGPQNTHHLVHSSLTNYTKQTRELKLDERWRKRIDAETQAKIEAVMRQIPVQAARYLPEIKPRNAQVS